MAKKPTTTKPARPKLTAARSVKRAAATSPAPDPSDWRVTTLDRVRTLITQADAQIVEEVKWRKPSNAMQGVAAWSRAGLICTGETYKDKVKLTFAKGATLDDPSEIFNASLGAGTRRAIDLFEGDTLNAAAFKALIRSAVALNLSKSPAPRAPTTKQARTPVEKPRRASTAAHPPDSDTPRLLSGGNPQIAKGYGDQHVQAYITATPGWKQAVVRELDQIIERAVPGVRKAVKWNSPLYGAPAREGTDAASHWFMSMHGFTNYVKVAFFKGASLTPLPPGTSKQKDVRYLDIREQDTIDEKQIAAWIKQASKLPGEKM